MHIHKTKRIIKAALYSAIIAGAAGAATGTLAWYSYQKDVNIGMTGTSIKADKEIQVGLRTAVRNQDFEDLYALGEIEIEDNVKFNSYDSQSFTIYWVRGNYVTEVLHSFQKLVVQSAVGTLNAITSGKYTTGCFEDIGNDSAAATSWTGFKKQPFNFEGKIVHGGYVTDRKDYFYLPLVFRALSEDKDSNGGPIYLPNEKIFLSEFITQDMEAGENDLINLGKAIRCKVDYPVNDNSSENFIFDPNATTVKNLSVGGRLNLQPDIYYDYDVFTRKQVAYGEWENLVYESTVCRTEPTISYDDCTTFDANSVKGGLAIDMSQSKPSVCQTLAASDAIEKNYETGHGITTTRLEDCYAYVDLSIYLEGWDKNIINLTAGREFHVDLQFSLQ
jgi:hypothetical protein